jgi:GST-like protein
MAGKYLRENIYRSDAVIVLYGRTTSPHCRKVMMMMEEVALPYTLRTVERGSRSEELLALNPSGTVPVMADRSNGAVIFESGAILLYLAEKTGRLLPVALDARAEVYKWLLFEAATLACAGSELYHYECVASDPPPYALARNRERYAQCAAILERQLTGRAFLCGELSIADYAIHPWAGLLEEFDVARLKDHPNLARWSRALEARCRDGAAQDMERQTVLEV